MNIALIGYGKMGKAIERFALERKHKVVCIIDITNQEAFNSPEFASADVAIEFTAPQHAVNNIRKAWAVGLPIVSGTTGWYDELPALKQELEEGGKTLFWSSNFSLGVNMVFELNRRLAEMMNQYPSYNVDITEIHHTEKKDAPSGTAITLANEIIENMDRKSKWCLGVNDVPADTIPIKSIREGHIPGIHTIRYDGPVDTITMTHEAKSRDGFALGAIVAAEFTAEHKGLLTMRDLMKF